MEYRILGGTGYRVSVLTIGGCGPGIAPREEDAIKAFELALSYGLNLVDIAPSYGKAEVRLGPYISKYRDRLVVMEKTLERSKEGAWKELKQSLKLLGADYFDIYQFHAVDTLEDLDKIFSEHGAMKAFLKARDQGLIKYIGITSHNKKVLLKALERFDFDTIMTPVIIGSLLYPRPENDFRPILKIARDRDIGVIAIKAIAKGRWRTEERRYQTWYEPFEDPEDIRRALSFVLSQEGVTTYSIACDVRLWPRILEAGKDLRKLSEEELEETLEYFKRKGAKPLFPEELAKKLLQGS